MPTIEVPDFWFLITPDGKIDGSLHAVLPGGRIRATPEQAHEVFTRNKRTRDKEIREGWTVRPGTREEMSRWLADMAKEKSA